jgi:hypothetical protein
MSIERLCYSNLRSYSHFTAVIIATNGPSTCQEESFQENIFISINLETVSVAALWILRMRLFYSQ